MHQIVEYLGGVAREPLQVAIIGAGAGGRAMAVHLTLAGCNVRLHDSSTEIIEAIRSKGGVEMRIRDLSRTVFARIPVVTSQVEEAVVGADLIAVVVPAFLHDAVARAMAPHLTEGQVVWLHPGGTCGTLEFRKVLCDLSQRSILLAEAENLIYACASVGKTGVCLNAVKRSVKVAGLPAKDNKQILSILGGIYPQLTEARNILEVGIGNIGMILHPITMIMNCARVEHETDEFEFYAQGVSPSVTRVMEVLDRERIAVGEAYSVDTLSVTQWIRESYGVDGSNYFTFIQNMNMERFGRSPAPKSLSSRYVSEDVPYGIVPLIGLGTTAGVDMPCMEGLVVLASAAAGINYACFGRSLERLGLSGISSTNILSLVYNGD